MHAGRQGEHAMTAESVETLPNDSTDGDVDEDKDRDV